MHRILTKRERVILYLTISVIIFSIVFNFVLTPILKRNELLNKEINIAKIKLKKYLRLLSKKDYIQNKYNKFVSGVNLSDTGKDTLVDALSELENLAKQANIRIIDIRPQGAKNINLYKEILIDLRTEGAIESYLKFIYNIENSLSLLCIRRFQLTARPNTQTLEGSFSILQISVE